MDYTEVRKEGRASQRDSIIAMLIGMQNANGDHESEEYKAFQKVMDRIEYNFGEMFGEVK